MAPLPPIRGRPTVHSRSSAWSAHQRYVADHPVGDLLSGGLEALLQTQPEDAAAFLAAHFAKVASVERHDTARTTTESGPSADDDVTDDKWSILAWAKGAGVHRVIAAALQRGAHSKGATDDDSQAALAFVRGLSDRAELQQLLCSPAVAEGIVDEVWMQVVALKGAMTSEEVHEKFAGAVELSFSGLNTFFGGTEAVVGPPKVPLLKAMEDE